MGENDQTKHLFDCRHRPGDSDNTSGPTRLPEGPPLDELGSGRPDGATASNFKLKELVSAKEAADFLGVSVRLIQSFCKTGEIVSFTVGRKKHIRIRQSDLTDFITRRINSKRQR